MHAKVLGRADGLGEVLWIVAGLERGGSVIAGYGVDAVLVLERRNEAHLEVGAAGKLLRPAVIGLLVVAHPGIDDVLERHGGAGERIGKLDAFGEVVFVWVVAVRQAEIAI